jgi:hydrogenase-4 component E
MTVVALSCLALTFVVVASRRRSVAIAAITTQTALLAVAAAAGVSGAVDLHVLVAACALGVRAIVIGWILTVAVRKTRESRPVRAAVDPMLRVVIGVVFAVAVTLLVPPFGLHDATVEHAAVAIVALGMLIPLLRRATVLQVIGILSAENGIALIALSAPHPVPGVIELGVVFDLILLTVVATAFHHRIFDEYGSGDASLLSELYD